MSPPQQVAKGGRHSETTLLRVRTLAFRAFWKNFRRNDNLRKCIYTSDQPKSALNFAFQNFADQRRIGFAFADFHDLAFEEI